MNYDSGPIRVFFKCTEETLRPLPDVEGKSPWVSLLTSSDKHCGSAPENPSLTATWREAPAERLSQS